MTQLTHMGHRTYNDAGDWIPAISASGTRGPRIAPLAARRDARHRADHPRLCRHRSRAVGGRLDGVEIASTAAIFSTNS